MPIKGSLRVYVLYFLRLGRRSAKPAYIVQF